MSSAFLCPLGKRLLFPKPYKLKHMKTINFFKTALLTIALFVCGNVGAEIAYNANFTNQTGASGSYSPNVTISLENQEWYASYCYFGSNEFRLGHNKTTGVVPSKFLTNQPQGASIEMLWDIANVTKISVLSEKSYGDLSDWYIFESTDEGSSWTQVATGAYTVGATWEYTTTSPKSNARYAFVITGPNSPRATLSTITIEQTSTSSVSTPTFTISSGKYTAAQTVAIDCANSEATIYYTLDNSDPTTSETAFTYSEPILISTTTTLKAVAQNGDEYSNIASATYTFPTEVDNIAAFNQAENNDFVKITNPITVTYINGANIYAQDESGSMLIYDFNFAETEGLTNGSIINNITGENTLYNGAPQMKNVFFYTLSEHISIINPTTVETLSTADVHKYIKLEDAQFDNSYSFTESSTINANLSTHGNIVVRNNFKNFNMDVNSTDKYDIVGFVSVYQNAPQIYPISIIVTTPSITLSTNSLAFETVENNQTKDLTFTVNGANLSENATLAITGENADYFTCDPTSITPAEDGSIAEETITVTYQPTATGEHAATLTLTCGDLVKEIALTGTCINPMLATPVATEATAITDNGFIANWEAVENATSYEVNVWTSQEALHETFDTQDGTGGNDGQWSGTVASNDVNGLADWTLENAYGANECIKLGAGSKLGVATTPALNIEGNATLTFRAGAWDSKSENTTLLLSLEGTGTLSETEVTLAKGEFQEYTITLTGISANTKISFKGKQASNSRFFLDDIKVIGATPITGSPFTVTGSTNTTIINLEEETTYYYNVVAKADGYTASAASNTISVITSNSTGTGLCNQPEMEGITFNGEEIINSQNLDVVVYNAVGQMVVRSNENINMSSYPAGVYVIKAANGASMKIVK